MADFQPTAPGKGRRKLSTPRIDLTPMVNLGFLLITFFMYTTTLARPKVMELAIPLPPKDYVDRPVIPEESTITLLPAGNHRIAFYNGIRKPAEPLNWSSGKELRSLLQKESVCVANLPAHFSREAHMLHVLIKPDTGAAYEDIVNCLDEMTINAVPFYTLMRITLEEQAAIKKFPSPVYGK